MARAAGDARARSRVAGGRVLSAAARLRAVLARSASFLALFALVYGGSELVARAHGLRVRVDLPFERAIPLVPWTVLLYVSLYPAMLVAAWVASGRGDLERYHRELRAAILLAVPGFLLLPASVAYVDPPRAGVLGALLELADRGNLDFELVPSLHVAFAIATASALARGRPSRARVLLGAWAAAVALSTLTTHQHHVLDVVSGAALSALVPRAARSTRAIPGARSA